MISRCTCFSLCHPEEVIGYLAPAHCSATLPPVQRYSPFFAHCTFQARYFFLRLPIVAHEASPWYPYLLAVYHTDSVPLPFDLRTSCTQVRSATPIGHPTASDE